MSAGGSNKKAGFQPIRQGHTPEAVCDLRFGLIGQGFAASRSVQPFIGADAGHGERLPASHPSDEANVNHLAARRGLFSLFHDASIAVRAASVSKTIHREHMEDAQ